VNEVSVVPVFIVIGLLAGLVAWAVKAAQQREEQLRREQFQRDMLADRADYEDRLYQQGDPRGMHGRYMPPASTAMPCGVKKRATVKFPSM